MKKILIVAPFYLPSAKGGGPIQSIKNIVENLNELLDVIILTSDRDLGDEKNFDNINLDEINLVNNIKVIYTKKSELNINKIIRILNYYDIDKVYLNSFFDPKFSINFIFANFLNKEKFPEIIICPRGEFSKAALEIKSNKKQMYIKMSKILNLYNDVIWHATNKNELNCIKDIFGDNIKSTIISNISRTNFNNNKIIDKEVGSLNIVSISRIHPIKNIMQGLKCIKQLKGGGKLLYIWSNRRC